MAGGPSFVPGNGAGSAGAGEQVLCGLQRRCGVVRDQREASTNTQPSMLLVSGRTGSGKIVDGEVEEERLARAAGFHCFVEGVVVGRAALEHMIVLVAGRR